MTLIMIMDHMDAQKSDHNSHCGALGCLGFEEEHRSKEMVDWLLYIEIGIGT